jgi:signal transduction histidine kinase
VPTPSVLILTDDSEFARLLSARWRAERRPPSLTVLNGQVEKASQMDQHDLVIIGPVAEGILTGILSALPATAAAILCAPAESREIHQLRLQNPRLPLIPLREDWTQTLVLVAGESLRRVEAARQTRQALAYAAQSERDAILGRYMLEMKHSVNNALTSILGNAELLLLEPGQLTAQSLQQIKTVHHMSLRLNEIMQRFSSLASEIRDTETSSQPETEAAAEKVSPRA